MVVMRVTCVRSRTNAGNAGQRVRERAVSNSVCRSRQRSGARGRSVGGCKSEGGKIAPSATPLYGYWPGWGRSLCRQAQCQLHRIRSRPAPSHPETKRELGEKREWGANVCHIDTPSRAGCVSCSCRCFALRLCRHLLFPGMASRANRVKERCTMRRGSPTHSTTSAREIKKRTKRGCPILSYVARRREREAFRRNSGSARAPGRIERWSVAREARHRRGSFQAEALLRQRRASAAGRRGEKKKKGRCVYER